MGFRALIQRDRTEKLHRIALAILLMLKTLQQCLIFMPSSKAGKILDVATFYIYEYNSCKELSRIKKGENSNIRCGLII